MRTYKLFVFSDIFIIYVGIVAEIQGKTKFWGYLPVAADCGGQDTYANAPSGPQSKILVVKKGKMTFLPKRGKMTLLTPGTLDWGHLHRHPAPRNPPQLVPTYLGGFGLLHAHPWDGDAPFKIYPPFNSTGVPGQIDQSLTLGMYLPTYSFTLYLRFRQKVVFRMIGGAESRCASFSSIGRTASAL